MARKSIGIDITAEDIAYARRQDRYNCAIVRAIQRQIPEATRVMADAKTIRFTLANSDTDITRYVFETPRSVVNAIIEPFVAGVSRPRSVPLAERRAEMRALAGLLDEHKREHLCRPGECDGRADMERELAAPRREVRTWFEPGPDDVPLFGPGEL